MVARMYALVEVVEGRMEEALQTLRNRPGVVAVDPLEDTQDIMLVIEARDRKGLVRLILQTIVLTGGVIENARIMPTQSGLATLSPANSRLGTDKSKKNHANAAISDAA